jgi:cell shape-determining protein MreC
MKKYSSITRESSRLTSRNSSFYFGCALVLVLLFLYAFIPRVVSFLASIVLIPIHHIETWVTTSNDTLPLYLRDRSVLIDELTRYQEEASARSGDILTIELLSKENDELRALLGDQETDRVLAGVVHRPTELPYDVFVIDKGSDDGIAEGAAVYLGPHHVIGVVDRVYKKGSTVMLASAPGFSSSVFIAGPNVYAEAHGIGGGVIRIGVPQGIPLSVGNLVLLPGVSSGVYGSIVEVRSSPTQPEQEVFVTSSASLSSIRFVTVGKSSVVPASFEEIEARVRAHTRTLTAPIPEGVLLRGATGTTTHSSSTLGTTTPSL